jgi:hypothetical protein
MIYLVMLFIGAIPAAWKNKDARLLIGIPLAITTMHLAWGAGFLWSLITWLGKREP